MQNEVEPFAFVILGDVEADGELQRHEDRVRCGGAIGDRDGYAEHLRAEAVV